MPEAPVDFTTPSNEIRKGGVVMGLTNKIYFPIDGPTITIAEILIRGDLSGELEYNGRVLQVEAIDEAIGLEVGPSGPRGPIWRGVRFRVMR
jgi:hypothetical protein